MLETKACNNVVSVLNTIINGVMTIVDLWPEVSKSVDVKMRE